MTTTSEVSNSGADSDEGRSLVVDEGEGSVNDDDDGVVDFDNNAQDI